MENVIREACGAGTLHEAVDRCTEACINHQLRGKDSSLTKDEIILTIKALDDYGVFALRNSVNRVAFILGVSRVFIYKHLKA